MIRRILFTLMVFIAFTQFCFADIYVDEFYEILKTNRIKEVKCRVIEQSKTLIVAYNLPEYYDSEEIVGRILKLWLYMCEEELWLVENDKDIFYPPWDSNALWCTEVNGDKLTSWACEESLKNDYLSNKISMENLIKKVFKTRQVIK